VIQKAAFSGIILIALIAQVSGMTLTHGETVIEVEDVVVYSPSNEELSHYNGQIGILYPSMEFTEVGFNYIAAEDSQCRAYSSGSIDPNFQYQICFSNTSSEDLSRADCDIIVPFGPDEDELSAYDEQICMVKPSMAFTKVGFNYAADCWEFNSFGIEDAVFQRQICASYTNTTQSSLLDAEVIIPFSPSNEQLGQYAGQVLIRYPTMEFTQVGFNYVASCWKFTSSGYVDPKLQRQICFDAEGLGICGNGVLDESEQCDPSVDETRCPGLCGPIDAPDGCMCRSVSGCQLFGDWDTATIDDGSCDVNIADGPSPQNTTCVRDSNNDGVFDQQCDKTNNRVVNLTTIIDLDYKP